MSKSRGEGGWEKGLSDSLQQGSPILKGGGQEDEKVNGGVSAGVRCWWLVVNGYKAGKNTKVEQQSLTPTVL